MFFKNTDVNFLNILSRIKPNWFNMTYTPSLKFIIT